MGILKNTENRITAFGNVVSDDTITTVTGTSDSYPTRSSVGIHEYQDDIGYYSSKKAFSVSEDSSSTVAYILNNRASGGTQLVIDTYKAASGSFELNKSARIIPTIPYRYTLADYNLLKSLKGQFADQPVDNTGSSLLFNPGFTRGTRGDVSSVNFGDLEFYKSNAERYEINLTRGQESALVGKNFTFWKNPSKVDQTVITNISNIKIDDYQASMIVIPESTTKDIIYLSISSKVTLHFKYRYNGGVWHTGQQMSWCVPVVLKYEVDKSAISSNAVMNLDPIAWTYPISLDDFHDITSTDSSGLENKAVISGRHVSHLEAKKVQNAFWPFGQGALVDIAWNENFTTNRLEVVASIGKEEDLNDSISHSRNITHVYQSFEEFSVNAYNPPNSIYRILKEPKAITQTLQIEVKDDLIWVVGSQRNTSVSEVSPITFLLGIRSYETTRRKIISYTRFTNADSPDIVLSPSNKFYLHILCVSNATSYILNIPNTRYDADSMRNSLINTSNLANAISEPKISLEHQLPGNLWARSPGVLKKPDASDVYYSKLTNNVGVNPSMKKIISKRFLTSHSTSGGNDILEIHDVLNISHGSSLKFETRIRINDTSFTSSVVDNQIRSVQGSGLPDGDYYIADLYRANSTGPSSKKSTTNPRNGLTPRKVYRSPEEFNLGKPQVEYWRDPLFGSEYWKNDSYDWDQDRGVKLQINITGCYGVFSEDNPLSLQSFDDSLTPNTDPNRRGGIKVNEKRRSDFDFKYYGNKEAFQATFSTWNGGYAANPTNAFKVSCNYNGQNILIGTKDKANIYPTFWSYDETGYFHCYIPITIDPIVDANGRDFTQANYALSGVEMTVEAVNKYGTTLDNKTLTFDIEPPDATGYIRSNSGYKTVTDAEFIYYRDATKNSSTFTEIHDIIPYSQAQNGEGIKSGQTLSLKGFGQSTGTLKTYSSSSLSRGMGVHYSYVPKLYGLKPNRTGTTVNESTNIVTYCKGHKYSIDNVELYTGISGSYSSNLLSNFGTYASTYNYVDVTNNYMDFKVTFDLDHENWQLLDGRKNYVESNVYPCVSAIYVYTFADLIWNNITKDYKELFQPVIGDNTLTYPNVTGTKGFGKFWWNYLVDNSLYPDGDASLYATGIYLPGTSSSLSSQDIILSIYKSGRYRIYLTVEDEFGQFSEFCLTNPTNYYNFPFEE